MPNENEEDVGITKLSWPPNLVKIYLLQLSRKQTNKPWLEDKGLQNIWKLWTKEHLASIDHHLFMPTCIFKDCYVINSLEQHLGVL